MFTREKENRLAELQAAQATQSLTMEEEQELAGLSDAYNAFIEQGLRGLREMAPRSNTRRVEWGRAVQGLTRWRVLVLLLELLCIVGLASPVSPPAPPPEVNRRSDPRQSTASPGEPQLAHLNQLVLIHRSVSVLALAAYPATFTSSRRGESIRRWLHTIITACYFVLPALLMKRFLPLSTASSQGSDSLEEAMQRAALLLAVMDGLVVATVFFLFRPTCAVPLSTNFS